MSGSFSGSSSNASFMDYSVNQTHGGISFGGADDKPIMIFAAGVFVVAAILIIIKKVKT